MLVSLFVVFLVLSLVLVGFGLGFREHSELALIGFVFLFILGLNFEAGSFQYKIGVHNVFECWCCGNYTDEQRGELFGAHECTESENSSLVVAYTTDVYADFDSGGVLAHFVGFWLMISSVVGFIAVLIGLRGGWNKND